MHRLLVPHPGIGRVFHSLLNYGEPQRDRIARLQRVENGVVAGPEGVSGLRTDLAAQCAPVDPRGDAHGNAFSRLVLDHHLALIGQVAIHVEPGRGPVQEQVDLGVLPIRTAHYPFPGIVQALRPIRRAALSDPGGRNVGRSQMRGEDTQRALDHVLGHFLPRVDDRRLVRHNPLRAGRARRPGLGHLLQQIRPHELGLDQVVADRLIDIVPVVAEPSVTQANAERDPVAKRAPLDYPAVGRKGHKPQARDGKRTHVLVAAAHELLDPLVVYGDRILEHAS